MEQEVKNKIDQWLSGNYDQATKDHIQSLLDAGNEEELTDSFYKDLEFGTGGLRGIMGVGSNRMNKYTLGAATQGLSNYLLAQFPNQELSVAIAHDSRNNSIPFSQTVADIFSANGIKVYLFDGLRPTPELSFAVRHFGCQGGIVLTASHNPKEYNGYKVYWDDGAQVIAPHDSNIITEVNKIDSIEKIRFEGNSSLIEKIGEEVDELYLEEISKLSLAPEVIKEQKDLKIVYSPIHGTGYKLVPDVLRRIGFENVHVVDAQMTPDGNFPTVVYPNPEEAEALSLALKEAEKIDADLVMATDPDADRIGIAAKNKEGKFELLNGNQTGALLIYYLLKKWSDNGKLDGGQYIVKTIVTTELIKDIADKFAVESLDVLTGFKFIAGIIREREGKKTFIGGGEESYGYLIGEAVRDKDAIASAAFIAEMVAYARSNGKSVFDLLTDLYVEFGFYLESLISITKKGKSGAEEIQAMMKGFRENPPQTLGGQKVIEVKDYQAQETTDLRTGKKTTIELPKSNVLQFFTEDGSKVSARPSGTEPKIKFYFGVKGKLDTAENFDIVKAELKKKIDDITSDLK
ncbi:phospho-sugar mutase [Cyclobacteriaceae bacterium]|nr:phospho-sugar mutase [Cyclobacteriaceae bacterium]